MNRFSMKFQPQQREAVAFPPNVLAAFEGKAALLLDPAGTIRDATTPAAALLERSASDLAGITFGVVPDSNGPIQLDLLGSRGLRVISARTVPSDAAKGWTVVLLEDSTDWLPLADAGRAALLDTAPLLMKHGLVVQAWEWPQAEVSQSLRFLLAGAVVCLIGLTQPSGGFLHVRPRILGGEVIIGLGLQGSETIEAEGFSALFEQTFRSLQEAGGFLHLELGSNGLGMQLVLPLAQPFASR